MATIYIPTLVFSGIGLLVLGFVVGAAVASQIKSTEDRRRAQSIAVLFWRGRFYTVGTAFLANYAGSLEQIGVQHYYVSEPMSRLPEFTEDTLNAALAELEKTTV